jgi:hypothetical protein
MSRLLYGHRLVRSSSFASARPISSATKFQLSASSANISRNSGVPAVLAMSAYLRACSRQALALASSILRLSRPMQTIRRLSRPARLSL